MSKNALLAAIEEHDAKFIDLRFSDMLGKEQHITLPVSAVDDDLLEHGKTIDGSSFKGWQKIHQSDLTLLPDTTSFLLDPFYQDNTLFLRCDVLDPLTMTPYPRKVNGTQDKSSLGGILDIVHP